MPGGHRQEREGLRFPASPQPTLLGGSPGSAHLMPRSLDWQTSEEVAQILDHDSILLKSASEVGGMGA